MWTEWKWTDRNNTCGSGTRHRNITVSPIGNGVSCQEKYDCGKECYEKTLFKPCPGTIDLPQYSNFSSTTMIVNILFVIIFMTFQNHISDEGSSSYTVTTNGSCSANCGNGSRIVITLSCHIQASSLFKCDKNITYEPCNLRECPSKLLWCLLNPIRGGRISMILI